MSLSMSKAMCLESFISQSKHQDIPSEFGFVLPLDLVFLSMLRHRGSICPSHFLVGRCFGPAAEIYLQVTLEHGRVGQEAIGEMGWDDGFVDLHKVLRAFLGEIDIERCQHVGRK